MGIFILIILQYLSPIQYSFLLAILLIINCNYVMELE